MLMNAKPWNFGDVIQWWLIIFFICTLIFIGLLIKYCSSVCQNPTKTQEQKRKQIVTLLNSGISCITKISRDTGVSRLTIYLVKKRFDEKVPIQHKKGAGRPTIIRNRIGYSCARYVQNDKQKPVREIAAEISQKPGLKVSKSTVHRCLTSMGYRKLMARRVPMLSEKSRLLRLDWAKKNKYKHWYRAVFSDEASFWLRSGRLRMWTKSNKTCIIPTVKHSPKIHIWAAFSSMGTFPLCIFTRNMDGNFFVFFVFFSLWDPQVAFTRSSQSISRE